MQAGGRAALSDHTLAIPVVSRGHAFTFSTPDRTPPAYAFRHLERGQVAERLIPISDSASGALILR